MNDNECITSTSMIMLVVQYSNFYFIRHDLKFIIIAPQYLGNKINAKMQKQYKR